MPESLVSKMVTSEGAGNCFTLNLFVHLLRTSPNAIFCRDGRVCLRRRCSSRQYRGCGISISQQLAADGSRVGLGEMSFEPGSLAAARTDDTPLADSFFTPSDSHTPACVKQPSRRGVCVCVCVLISRRPRTTSAAPWRGFCLRPATWGPGPAQ